jgi:hypothetical protein
MGLANVNPKVKKFKQRYPAALLLPFNLNPQSLLGHLVVATRLGH